MVADFQALNTQFEVLQERIGILALLRIVPA